MNEPRLIEIPPSIGGTGLACVGGMMVGWNLAAIGLYDATLAPEDWLPGGGLLVFVLVLLAGMQVARRQMNLQATPASLRRQWLLVIVGLVVGLGVGFGFVLFTGTAGG